MFKKYFIFSIFNRRNGGDNIALTRRSTIAISHNINYTYSAPVSLKMLPSATRYTSTYLEIRRKNLATLPPLCHPTKESSFKMAVDGLTK